MGRTAHVYPAAEGGWAVKREGASSTLFRTQKEAIARAKEIMHATAPSQMIIHTRDGRLRGHQTAGWPRIQEPVLKSPHARAIEKAVSKVVLTRITAGDPHPPRV